MKIMENKLKQLEKENEDDFFRIRSEERRKEVSRMIKYISSSSLPLYQIQIIRKDLLGMAQEAERQELPLKDMLGVEPREFCDEIIENAATPARKERAFQVVIDVLQPFAIYFTFMWTCGGMPSRERRSCNALYRTSPPSRRTHLAGLFYPSLCHRHR